MHRESTNTLELNQLTFSTSKRFQPTRMACKPIRTTAIKWHKILGHAGANAIKQFPKHIISVKLTELTTERAPLKIKCKVYLLAKHI